MTALPALAGSGSDASVNALRPHICGAKNDELRRHVSALYEASRERIYCFLVSKGLRPQVAQEATQDVFVDLFRALAQGTRIESEQRWLFAVAGRTVVDHWRREHYPMRVDFDAEPNAVANVPSSTPTPEAQVERKQRLTRVAAGLRNLPNDQRLCIELRAQGLRYREIGKVLGAPTSTVAEWLVAAIGSLRAQADGELPLTNKRDRWRAARSRSNS
jgi:RNA polymerase sigma-70 factor (ECF subfamily)